MSWGPILTASDASLWGRGVVRSPADPEAVAEVGLVSERWRFPRGTGAPLSIAHREYAPAELFGDTQVPNPSSSSSPFPPPSSSCY